MALIIGRTNLTKKEKKELKEGLELLLLLHRIKKVGAELRKEAMEKKVAKKKNNHGGD
jgi:hypothetical protein